MLTPNSAIKIPKRSLSLSSTPSSSKPSSQPFIFKGISKPKVGNDFFSLPPAVYGTTFLLLIPVFGLLYSTLPDMHFNHEHVGFLEAMYFSTITVTLKMNTYLNRVNQLLGIEAEQTPVAQSDSEGRTNLQNTAKASSFVSAKVAIQLAGIHEPIPKDLVFTNLQHLFKSSNRLTDDPQKPQIWYYY